ncbi:alpha/beta hydrolase fold containing protein [Emticicia oligotrophica DSM 17448]|uniref:Alpha/beta hydrolase fold containing protein n=1 Tax=Emticicia oligotrophica (strain DSM 17448 / CIP 109782 / MTCC 6937 / GPTSA100-15) TaxID=929562 RepID=A0ABM5N2P2_EMTOG|nr:alpha/beta hydrolase [Emticicia oligotrophica]AFK03699.1 alpha/beta hydrolase fold containing protein [Emticicia oligotrophica DSM 17448]
MKTFLSLILVALINVVTQAQTCELSYFKEAKTIKLNDSLTIAYKELGKGKETILMVHGLGGNMSHWMHNFIKNQHCIAIDLPSYGLSTMHDFKPKTDLLDFYADVILAFIDKKKLKNVVLVGHSMGGQTAIVTVLRKHPAIKKLILAAPAGFETFSEAEAQSLIDFAKPETFKNQTETLVKVSLARNFFEMPASAEKLIADRLLIPQCESFNPYFVAVAKGVRGMLEHPIRKELNKIDVPTLVIFGENDALIPNKFLHKSLTTKQIADMGAEIPKVKITMIPKAGHLLMFEQAQRFNEEIATFLK